MTLRIHLLGTPRIERDGVVAPPVRGHKPWGLLAYLLSGNGPVLRERLIDLLFPDAVDPLGALRWNLSQLRRLLGSAAEVRGDPLRLVLPQGSTVDTHLVTRGSWVEALAVPGLGLPLLAGMPFPGSPAFEMWLEGERRHLQSAAVAVLQEAARARLVRGDPQGAVVDARRLMDLDPLEENAHVLLILALRASGAHEAAKRHASAGAALLRRELGVDATPVLSAALETTSVGGPGGVERPAVLARIEAGESAVSAGAWAAGIDTLRRAAWDARILGDRHILARALVALGSALVHAARGTDEEGAAMLLEGAEAAMAAEQPSIATVAHRELAYVALLRGQYDRCLRWLTAARQLAEGIPGQLGWIHLIGGMAQTDLGRHSPARRQLGEALAAARSSGARRCESFVQAGLGRLAIQREEWDDAHGALTASLRLARDENWLAFRPYPEAMLGEVHLATGDLDRAADTFDEAFALGQHLGDPCWESLATRGRGLVAARRGDRQLALELLDEAPRTCRRLPDSYRWIEGYAQDGRATTAIQLEAPAAPEWNAELVTFAARYGLRELQARAAIHRVRLGERGATEVARALVGQVDNPALAARLATAI